MHPNSGIAPAFAELAGRRRWCWWRHEQRDGHWTKVPYAASGGHASVSNAQTWAPYAEVAGRGDGPGIFLGRWGDGRWLVGVDLDMCIADDGTLEEWAAEIVSKFATYAEISPSGNGIKIYGWCEQPVTLRRNKITPRPRHNGEDRDAEIALYVHARYFCVTGVTWGAYDTLEDVTGGVLWLAGRLADFAEQPSLPAAFRSALQTDEYLRRLWTAGEHAGADKSRSGADAALANALGRLLLSREEFKAVLAAFAHGQPRPLPARQVKRLWRLSQTPPDGTAAGDKADDWANWTGEDDKPRWTSGDAHEGKDVMWMWENRLVAGHINLVAGMGSAGKDVLCCDIAARVTTGRDWPDGTPCQPGLVGYVSSEDGISDTLIPRLTAAGADLSRIRIWNHDDPPQPDDLDGLQLVVISPLVQILPDGRLAQYDQGIRKMIGPWQAKCEASGCTIVGTVHYNKKNDLAAVQRILGSVGLPNALRNTWCDERDTDDATLRLFMRVKANLTPDDVDGLAYRIVHVGPWSQSIRCDWQPEPVEKTADDVLQSKVKNPKQPVGQWLVAYLRQHGCMAAQSVIIEAGAKAGYSYEAIRKAKQRNPKIASSCAGIGSNWWWQIVDADDEE